MSLDSLFEQILLTEQRFTEQTQKFKEVKVAIIRCTEKTKSAAEKCESINEELDKKTQQLCAMRLQRDLMKKCEDQMLKQIEGLLCQKSHLRDRLAKIKRESKEEEANFLQEISSFNSDFSLEGNKEMLSESQTHSEILDLEREVESLYKEMELMSHRNSHMSSIQQERRALQLELEGLGNVQKDLDRQLSEAETMTESLRAERLFVSQKHLTDSTCLRLRLLLEVSDNIMEKIPMEIDLLRKELEMLREEGELGLLRDMLSSEIQLLKSKLDSSQGNEQH